jgi:hypothetical protein
MSSSRYYVIGNDEAWLVQLKDRQQNRDGSRRKLIEFAIGAAQMLGLQGKCAHVCMLDDDGRIQCKWSYDTDHAFRRCGLS